MSGTLFSESFFRKAGRLTILLVYVVIFLGGLVRVTGSGMGCPDWPKCFGKWVPPTDVSQLPPDYKEIFKKPGHEVAEFNVYHTYTEYINRLSGALLGLVMLLTTISSFRFFHMKKWVTLACVAALLLTGFQGWIGAKVVDSYLAGWMVTIHMLIALVIVAVMMLPVYLPQAQLEAGAGKAGAFARTLSVVLLLLTLVQICIGTQVREKVDELMKSIPVPDNWNTSLGEVFNLHKATSLLLFAVSTALVFLLHREAGRSAFRISILVLALILLQWLTGTLNVFFHFPGVAQVMHIVMGTVAFGIEFYLIMLLWVRPAQQITPQGVN